MKKCQLTTNSTLLFRSFVKCDTLKKLLKGREIFVVLIYIFIYIKLFKWLPFTK